MKNLNLTLFKYSIIFDNKQWQTHLVRFILLAVLLYALFAFSNIRVTTVTAPGLTFFKVISYINLIFIIIIGLLTFPAAITEEKDTDVLHLLLMTGLSPLTLILSKSTSKLIEGSALLVIQLPFTLLAITLGGVSLYQIFAVFILLLSVMFFLCNLGLFASVICKDAQKAASLTLFLMLPIFITHIPGAYTKSPFFRISEILTVGFNDPMIDLGVSGFVIMGCVLFGLAYFLFEYVSRKQPAPKAPSRALRYSHHLGIPFFCVNRIKNNPFSWKEFYFTSSGKVGVVLRGLLIMILISAPFVLAYFDFFDIDLNGFGVFYLSSGIFIIFLEVVNFSNKMLQREIKEKTISMLLLLPVSPVKIAFSMLWGIVPNLIPTIFYILIGFALYPAIFKEPVFWCIVVAVIYYMPLAVYALVYSPLNDKSWFGTVIFIIFIVSFVFFPLLIFLPLYGIPLIHKAMKAKLHEISAR